MLLTGKLILGIFTYVIILLCIYSVLFEKAIDSSVAIMYAAAIGTYGASKAAPRVAEKLARRREVRP